MTLNRLRTVPNVILLVLVTGILASGAGLSVFAEGRESRDRAWGRAADVVQDQAFRAHVALELVLDGDDAVDVTADIVAPLELVGGMCSRLRDGGLVDGITIPPFPPGAWGDTATVCANVEAYTARATELATRAETTSEEVTPGQDLELLQFAAVLEDLRRLDGAIADADAADQSLIQLLGWVLTAFLALMLAGVVAVGRHNERRVQEIGRRNQVVLDGAGEGIYGLDGDGIGVFTNPAAATLLGRAQEDLVGVNAHDLLHVRTDGSTPHPRTACPVLRALHDDGSHAGHADRFLRSDGTSFPAEFTASTVPEDSIIGGGVIVFRDVTERRAVEELKDQFVSMVSHELRTPLTSIHGSLGLLAGGALGDMPPSARRMIDIATTNTSRLVRLINDILDIERMRSGELRMEREVIRADEVVEQAVASMRGMAESAEVELSVGTEPVLVWADRDRITQVLVNLVSNAIKFSDPGAPVTVTLEGDGPDALLTVGDRGRGIPDDKLGTVFGRFQQVDASDSRQKGGTGLGLAISQGIVVQHDGRIWAEQRPGGGTAVHMVLPAVPTHEVDVADSAPRVLVVDDDPSVLQVVCAILARDGYHAIPARSGDEAIGLAMESPPDAVVLDLLMPGTNGWQVLTRLRDHPHTAGVPVVILSVLREDTESVSDGSYEDWITKPFDDAHLLAALKRALEPLSHRMRAVIVEDDDDLAAVLVATFERHGVEVRHAATASEAAAIVPTSDPDLIVLDLHLPDGDGVELLHDLRGQGHLRGVPVVVYTGYDVAPEDRDQLDRDGAVVFTKTRVSPREFEERVLGLIGALVEPETADGA